MSHNCGAIHVEVRGLSQREVVDAVVAYWKKKKAVVDTNSPLDIEPLTLEDADDKARLGYAIGPAVKGWFVVCDTEQYSADASLAEHLAKKLKTRVAWYTLWGASSEGAARLFGTWKRKAPKDTYDAVWAFASEFPSGTMRFEDLSSAKARKGFALIGFKSVDPETYDLGPGPAAPKAKKKAPAKKNDAQSDDDVLHAIDVAFLEKQFADVRKHIDALRTPAARWRALERITDHVYCMGIGIKAPAAHGLVLTLADAALDVPLSRAYQTWVKQKRLMSAHMVTVAYVGTLEAAAWANDEARFAAALALVDDHAATRRALDHYCRESAERLTKTRSAFAKKLIALASCPP